MLSCYYVLFAGLLSFAYDVLAVLPTVQRFGVIKMFLSTEDTRGMCYYYYGILLLLICLYFLLCSFEEYICCFD